MNLTACQPADEELTKVAFQEITATCPGESETVDMDELLDWVFGDDNTSDASGVSSNEEEDEDSC